MHCLDGCVQDIYAVDLFGLDCAYAVRYRFGFDGFANYVSVFAAHLLRVIEERVHEARRQYYGGGIYGPGKASAPGFIAAGFQYSLFIKIVKMSFHFFFGKIFAKIVIFPFSRS